MIFTDYYKGEKLTSAASRFDITYSTGEYDYFESLLINKRKFNVGGLSFNCGKRSDKWKGQQWDRAITKGSSNITSVINLCIENCASVGDFKPTNDACIIVYNSDYKDAGIKTIEIFIARGYKNDMNGLWNLFNDGELDHEVDELRKKAVARLAA